MADPATNTAYPVAIEVLPEISSGRRMIEPEVRHDVMHDKVHATLNALQALVGTTDVEDPVPLLLQLQKALAGGILVQCGSKDPAAPVLPVGTQVSGIAPSGYVITGWKLWCYPQATLHLDIWRRAFSTLPPTDSHSITGASAPVVANAISAQGDGAAIGDWVPVIDAGDGLTAVVTTNNDATWFALLLEGYKQ